jgi:hypothetical protein
MGKDKPAKLTTMNDMVSERAKVEREMRGDSKQFFFADTSETTPIIGGPQINLNNAEDLQLESKISQYNSEITNLDPDYANLTPITKILVRCYHIETERSPAGLITKPTVQVKVPTQNGVGYIGRVESPYAYQKRAVVVSVPDRYSKDENSQIKPGTIVQLSSNPLIARSAGKDYDFDMPYAFTHYSWQDILPPKDCLNKHFGYLIIPINEIEVIVSE